MTLDEMRAELDRWTCLPGWRFELIVNHPARVGGVQLFSRPHAVLRVHSRVPNTDPPHGPLEVVATYPVPLEAIWRGQISFANYLRGVVLHQLVEQCDEWWLMRDGVMVFDSHRGER